MADQENYRTSNRSFMNNENASNSQNFPQDQMNFHTTKSQSQADPFSKGPFINNSPSSSMNNQGMQYSQNPADKPISSLTQSEFLNLIKQSNAELRQEINQRIGGVEQRLIDNDDRVSSLGEQISSIRDWVKTIEERVNQGPGPKGSERVLHVRGWHMVNGHTWTPQVGSLPDDFFKMVDEVEHVSGNDFILHSRANFTYFQVGWMIANNWNTFRERCPGLDLRSKTELGKHVGELESRFFKDNRSYADVMRGRTKTKIPHFN